MSKLYISYAPNMVSKKKFEIIPEKEFQKSGVDVVEVIGGHVRFLESWTPSDFEWNVSYSVLALMLNFAIERDEWLENGVVYEIDINEIK